MKNKDENQVEKKIKQHPILYIFSAVILVIIIVTFIGAPIAGNFSGGQRIVFGEYDGEKIEYYPGNYLSNQKDMLAQKMDNSSNNNNFQLQAYQIWRGAFERTILHVALLKEVTLTADLQLLMIKLIQLLLNTDLILLTVNSVQKDTTAHPIWKKNRIENILKKL